MMKWARWVPAWVILLGGTISYVSAELIQADPSDDFSFTLPHGAVPAAYRAELPGGADALDSTELYDLISEKKVAVVLADRLDVFPKSQIPKLANHLITLCRMYRFDPAFILSMIDVESSFRVKASSAVGAVGLMQLMPATATTVLKYLGVPFTTQHLKASQLQVLKRSKLDPRVLQDPFVNTTLGVTYLAWLRDHYRGLSPYYLVAAYNVGPSRLDELRSRRFFRPSETLKYFEAIRRGVPFFRFYKPGSISPSAQMASYGLPPATTRAPKPVRKTWVKTGKNKAKLVEQPRVKATKKKAPARGKVAGHPRPARGAGASRV